MLCTVALLSLLVVVHSQQPFIFGPGVVEPGIIIIGPGGPIGPPPPFMPGPPPQQQHHRPTTTRPRPTTTTTRRPTTTTPRPTTSKPSSNQNSLSCGFTCTRKAEFRVSIDGTMTTATCSVSGNSRVRCEGCCQARGLAAGLSTEHTAGFPSNNGVDCICCFNREC